MNVSFKDATITDSRFTDCAFVDCYFRRTAVTEVRFTSSKFFGCSFPKARFTGCDFRYVDFFDGYILPGEMESNLPAEHNLREELTHSLALAAHSAGATRDARMYRLLRIRAREAHLRAAWKGASQWYRDHYPGLERLNALTDWLRSRLNGYLWGYGERWTRLAGNLFFTVFVVFPLLFWLTRRGISQPGGGAPRIADYWATSISSFLPNDMIATVEFVDWTARSVAFVESVCALVFAGLLVSMLLQAILRR